MSSGATALRLFLPPATATKPHYLSVLCERRSPPTSAESSANTGAAIEVNAECTRFSVTLFVPFVVENLSSTHLVVRRPGASLYALPKATRVAPLRGKDKTLTVGVQHLEVLEMDGRDGDYHFAPKATGSVVVKDIKNHRRDRTAISLAVDTDADRDSFMPQIPCAALIPKNMTYNVVLRDFVDGKSNPVVILPQNSLFELHKFEQEILHKTVIINKVVVGSVAAVAQNLRNDRGQLAGAAANYVLAPGLQSDPLGVVIPSPWCSKPGGENLRAMEELAGNSKIVQAIYSSGTGVVHSVLVPLSGESGVGEDIPLDVFALVQWILPGGHFCLAYHKIEQLSTVPASAAAFWHDEGVFRFGYCFGVCVRFAPPPLNMTKAISIVDRFKIVHDVCGELIIHLFFVDGKEGEAAAKGYGVPSPSLPFLTSEPAPTISVEKHMSPIPLHYRSDTALHPPLNCDIDTPCCFLRIAYADNPTIWFETENFRIHNTELKTAQRTFHVPFKPLIMACDPELVAPGQLRTGATTKLAANYQLNMIRGSAAAGGGVVVGKPPAGGPAQLEGAAGDVAISNGNFDTADDMVTPGGRFGDGDMEIPLPAVVDPKELQKIPRSAAHTIPKDGAKKMPRDNSPQKTPTGAKKQPPPKLNGQQTVGEQHHDTLKFAALGRCYRGAEYEKLRKRFPLPLDAIRVHIMKPQLESGMPYVENGSRIVLAKPDFGSSEDQLIKVENLTGLPLFVNINDKNKGATVLTDKRATLVDHVVEDQAGNVLAYDEEEEERKGGAKGAGKKLKDKAKEPSVAEITKHLREADVAGEAANGGAPVKNHLLTPNGVFNFRIPKNMYRRRDFDPEMVGINLFSIGELNHAGAHIWQSADKTHHCGRRWQTNGAVGQELFICMLGRERADKNFSEWFQSSYRAVTDEQLQISYRSVTNQLQTSELQTSYRSVTHHT